MPVHIIKYKKPARRWREALPLGNGHTGIMIYGSLKKEKLCFNEGTLWSGYPKDYNRAESLSSLERVRQLIFEGKNKEADALCEKDLSGFYTETFLPMAEVTLSLKGIKGTQYSRSLNLEEALHTVETAGAKSECFSSYPDKISAYRVTSTTPFDLVVKTKSKLHYERKTEGENLFLLGNAPDYVAPNYLRKERHPVQYDEGKGMAFCLQAQVQTNGQRETTGASIKVKNATEVVLYFVTATGFRGFDQMPETDRRVVQRTCQAQLASFDGNYDALKERHCQDFSSLYHKQSVSFRAESNGETDVLLNAVKKGGDETALAELLYHYGKYLLLSGSRKGGQPLTLQGLWNASLRPPWSSNYTVNINTEMNYWGASRAGLSDCIEPLIRMVHEALQTGEKTAEINYGCRGFACNHNLDLWRKTPPVQGSANYMFAPLCGVWLSNELYSHYQNGFLGDYEDEIREIVTEAARFASDFLVLHQEQYVICPSVSPENGFRLKGETCKLDYASAFDMALVKQAFQNALALSDDEELKTEIQEKLPRLYPFQKGAQGICEWHKDYETPEKGHRHFSPLYGFYPANLIGFYGDAEQTGWVRDLFRYRMDHSSQHIGWSAAWAICLSARLRDKETAQEVIRSMLTHSLFQNLFSVHPPYYFQIDGNLGFIASINELLLTVEKGVVELLPTLPDHFRKAGEVKNMVVNGAEISFRWEDGLVTEIQSTLPVQIRNKQVSDGVITDQNITLVEF